ncbi:MAG: hypothetical protein BroJett040_07050 [Oligoflexia bacterium]|nr:MAG: hypothetical protein BroJett040_07050 [Oligoflexia bacterium]
MRSMHLRMLLIVVLFVFGCQTVQKKYTGFDSKSLIIAEETDFKDKHQLQSSQVREDVDLLRYALIKAYGGRKYIASPIMTQALKSLEEINLENIHTSVQLRDVVDEILLTIPDGHLHIRSQESGQSPSRLATKRKPQVGKNLHQKENPPWALNFIRSQKHQVPVISITSLPQPDDPSWQGFKEAIDQIMSSRHLVIDLRGNGGGSDVTGRWLATKLAGHPIPMPYAYVAKSRTPETGAIALNAERFRLVQYKRLNKELPDYRKKRLAEKFSEYEKLLKAQDPEEEMIDKFNNLNEEVKSPGYKGNIYILIDAGCGSSCESIVEFFETVPNATTVGENTAGMVHFGNMGYIVLPHSQLVVQMATDFWKYKDDRYVENVGYAPKIKVPQGQDALQAVVKILRKK